MRTNPVQDDPASIFRQQADAAERNRGKARDQRLEEALSRLDKADRDPDAYIDAARCHKQSGRLRDALDILKKGIVRCPPSPALHEYYIERLEKCNRTELAIESAREAARLFPEHLLFSMRGALALPMLYRDSQEIVRYRQRFAEGLERIVTETRLDTATEQQRAFMAIGKTANKYLAYQSQNDRQLQMKYGAWLHRILAASFPQYVQRPFRPRLEHGSRLRVGYLSARFRNTSATQAFFGWLQEHDRNQIETFAYHVDSRTDLATERVERSAAVFRQLQPVVGDVAPAVLADRLHILVFLDVGMDPLMSQLAGLRLAPVQCLAWDHPVTSGLPTIDYFISAELTEPKEAADHYSETIVRLPGVGLCFTKPVIPTPLLRKTREDFHLREDATVYLSSQTIFKYLPDQDALFAQIALRVPTSQFVFLVTNEIVQEDFEKRMVRAFAATGLAASDHCVFLPELPHLDYWNLCQRSDVALDTIGWSGGISTLEVIACGLPVVTLPGSLMRGRQSLGILTQLAVTETIASSEAQYVDIAVRLGVDREWREGIVRQMTANYPRLYSDARPVRALEDFYRQVAGH